MENKIYKEAILDAKALRASAIANAKSMMQEAIEPAIQEMMRLKLSEELEEEIEEEDGLEETYDEGYGDTEEGYDHEMQEEVEEGEVEEEVTEATLEEILAELDGLEEDETLNEAEEEEEAEEETEEAEEESTEDVGDDTKVVELTLGDLKAALFPQMSAAPETEEMTADDEEAPVSLDEILAELEEKEHDHMEEMEEADHDDSSVNESILTDPNFYAGLIGLLGTIGPIGAAIVKDLKKAKTPEEKKGVYQQAANAIAQATGGEKVNENVLTDPNFYAGLIGLLGTIGPLGYALIKDLKKAKTPEEKKAVYQRSANAIAKATGGEQVQELSTPTEAKLAEELAIAKKTIATLRESVNEINLLNAKLLYMNKIFKAKNLAESEKVKVIKAFDRNTSVKEVKNTYETLKESLQTKKTQLKESVGFASKPIGSVAKNNIIEADPFINRWQKIAGIK